jgi:hypothetical protein
MRIGFAYLALLLASCATPPPPAVDPPEAAHACPAPAAAPAALPRWVSPEWLRAAYEAERAARMADEAALRECGD